MAENIDPRYLPYTSQEVKTILEQVEHLDETPTPGSNNPIKSGGVSEALGNYFNKETDVASEEEIRDIVRNYEPEPEPEPES